MPFALLLRRHDQFVDPETAVGEVVAPPEDVLGAAMVEQRRVEIARLHHVQRARPLDPAHQQPRRGRQLDRRLFAEIGRASVWERVCQYVWTSGVAVRSKKTYNSIQS